MKIAIYNWGPIKEATIDLSRPMIILTGPNNTGKTYLSYLVYELLGVIGAVAYGQLRNAEYDKYKDILDFNLIKEQGVVEKELDVNAVYSLFQPFLDDVKMMLPKLANIDCDSSKFNIRLMTTQKEWSKWFFELAITVNKDDSLSFEKEANSNRLKCSLFGKDTNDSLLRLGSLFQVLLTQGVYLPYMLTSDRGGIYTFSKEISLGRLRTPIIGNKVRYPKPVEEGLANAEDLANISKHHSEYYSLGEEIEQQILRGSVSVSDDGSVNFNNTVTEVEYNFSSSMVKTLAPLVFYLKYVASSGYILLYDEPEINLHPSNQILVARIFAKMINAGLRVMFATHSDYLIREINNMMMLSSLNEEKYTNYGYTSDEVLTKDMVEPYFFYKEDDGVKVSSLEVTKTGFDVSSIDDTIEKQNEIARNLYFDINE